MELNHDDSFLGEIVVPIDHGLVMVEAEGSQALHDDWDPAHEFVSAEPDSLYLSVRPSVDGPVTIGIVDSAQTNDATPIVYFDGTLRVESGVVVITEANEVVRFTVRRPRGDVRIKVLTDQMGLASTLLIAFE